MHNPDVSPGWASLGGTSPVGRHTGSDVVGEEASSLKGLGDLITCLPSTHVLGYDCDALRAEDCQLPPSRQKRARRMGHPGWERQVLRMGPLSNGLGIQV